MWKTLIDLRPLSQLTIPTFCDQVWQELLSDGSVKGSKEYDSKKQYFLAM